MLVVTIPDDILENTMFTYVPAILTVNEGFTKPIKWRT